MDLHDQGRMVQSSHLHDAHCDWSLESLGDSLHLLPFIHILYFVAASVMHQTPEIYPLDPLPRDKEQLQASRPSV